MATVREDMKKTLAIMDILEAAIRGQEVREAIERYGGPLTRDEIALLGKLTKADIDAIGKIKEKIPEIKEEIAFVVNTGALVF